MNGFGGEAEKCVCRVYCIIDDCSQEWNKIYIRREPVMTPGATPIARPGSKRIDAVDAPPTHWKIDSSPKIDPAARKNRTCFTPRADPEFVAVKGGGKLSRRFFAPWVSAMTAPPPRSRNGFFDVEN
jgi:hypothetical protein